jgi:lipase maturation factor 1
MYGWYTIFMSFDFPWSAPLSSIDSVSQWITGMDQGSTYMLTRWIFLRGIGIVYLIAFVSLWVQIIGLIGEQGILPANAFLDAVRKMGGRAPSLPTIFWFLGAGNTVLYVTCATGVVASIVLIAGFAPTLLLILLWILYLSVFTVGRDFLSFQWDTLLLETGFLAIFFAPTNLISGIAKETAVSSVALVLLWWLLFRFMVESGVVKLTSGDSAWRDLTALNYHYFTQPLPTWTSWYVHHLPAWFHTLSMILMYGIELLLPFFIFSSRPLRMASALGMVFLMLMISATGNYTFFTLLTIVLCATLIDDALWQKILPEQFLQWIGYSSVTTSVPVFLTAIVCVVGLFYCVISFFQLLETIDRRLPFPRVVRTLEQVVSPFRSVNSYGLFRVMTRRRPEIVIEGSNDGERWSVYAFKWKPGNPGHYPQFIEPHQPRLDWQMWFAALSSLERTPWFRNFLGRILQGEPSVLGLLKDNPFPDTPPTYVRAVLYEYEFTTPDERRRTGEWWKREWKGLYAPVMSRTGE